MNEYRYKDYYEQQKYIMEKKRYVEEELSQAVRELTKIYANKFCSECGQRGPTYVNVTQGSFCCMICSGLLRGLTPPHRVKSISMSTFTNSEVELLRKRGNEWNKDIYLALFKGTKPFKQPIDLQNLKDHLILKYEKRMWYSAPKCSTVIIGAKELFAIPKSGSCFAGFTNSSNGVREVIPKIMKNNDFYISMTKNSSINISPSNSSPIKQDINLKENENKIKKDKEAIFDNFDNIFGPPEPIKAMKLLNHSNSMFDFPTTSTNLYDWPCTFEETKNESSKSQLFDPFSATSVEISNTRQNNSSISSQTFFTFPDFYQNSLTSNKPNNSFSNTIYKDIKNQTIPLQCGNYELKYTSPFTTTISLDNTANTSKDNIEQCQNKINHPNPFLNPIIKPKLESDPEKHVYSNPFENISNCLTLTNNPFISQSQPSSLEKEPSNNLTFESFFTSTITNSHHHSEMILNER
uniref:Drongo (inferred by orthology to a D. melanogaster protein) n=1 Tax=Strongyloides venezuelensis TaxID=75913 RepID=A0A0K0F9U9_STRVS